MDFVAEKMTPTLGSTRGFFTVICTEESLTGKHQSPQVGMMSTPSTCPSRIRVGRNSLLLWESQDFCAHNDFSISLWNFFYENWRF